MAIPFSYSVRSLEADSFSSSLVGLLITVSLFLVWSGWFFMARVTIYEVGQIVEINPNGAVIANFPIEAQRRLKPRQKALIRFNTPQGSESMTVPAIVTNGKNENGQMEIELYAFWNTTLFEPQPSLSGQVEVEIEHVSPFNLVTHTTQQLLNARKIRN